MRTSGSLLILTLATCCQLSLAQDKIAQTNDPAQPAIQPVIIGPQSFRNVAELAEYIEVRISTYFTQIENAIQNPELQAALAIADTGMLLSRENQLEGLLYDNIKVRFYPNGLEEVDNYSTPACGFACINIATSSYEAPPPAEALLYDTSDANITLARAIFSESGQAIGVVVAHYPYELITESIKRLRNIGLYTEFQQSVSGKRNIIQKHGDARIKQGPARKVIRIKGTRWNIAVWTPGGVGVGEYEPPSIHWFKIVFGIIVLATGITLLIIYRKKHPVSPEAPVAGELDDVYEPEAVIYDNDKESKTLIMGDDATEVNISKSLKDSDVKTNKPN